MYAVVWTEMKKLRRCAAWKAGLLAVLLADLFAFAPVFANDGVRKDFTLVMNDILESNCIYFFPALILLTGGFLARREYADDTLKNLLTVPVSFRKLLLGKLLVLLFMTAAFSVFGWGCGVLLCGVAGLPDLTPLSAVSWMARILLGNLCLFIAVLPLTILSAFDTDAVYACAAAGLVYGTLARVEWAPMNYYPVKAVLILFDPQCGAGYDFVHYSKAGAGITLLAVFLLSAALFLLLRPAAPDRRKPPKKAARKKGW